MPPHHQNHSAALPTRNRENSERTRIQRLKASPSSHTIRPAGGSGIGPEQALEAIHKKPCAQRKSQSSPELPCERRTVPAEPFKEHVYSKECPLLCRYAGMTPQQACERRTVPAEPFKEHVYSKDCPLLCRYAGLTPQQAGSDPQKNLRAAQKPILPRASLRAQDRSRGALQGTRL